MSVFGARKRSFRIAANEEVIRSATEMEHIHGGGFRMFESCLLVVTARVLREAAAKLEYDERRMHREGHRNLTRCRI